MPDHLTVCRVEKRNSILCVCWRRGPARLSCRAMQSSTGAEVVRAVTCDGTFRVVSVDATEAVGGVLAAQMATGSAARCLGDLVVAAVLYRETMAPDLRVQVILKASSGKSHAVADSIAGGAVRGLLQSVADGAFELGPGALIQVMRTLHDGRIAQGVVEAPVDGGVAAALMAYMQQSEQVDSMLAIGTRFEGDKVVRAGGYMVQLLPEVGKGPLAIMTERLEDFVLSTGSSSRTGSTPVGCSRSCSTACRSSARGTPRFGTRVGAIGCGSWALSPRSERRRSRSSRRAKRRSRSRATTAARSTR